MHTSPAAFPAPPLLYARIPAWLAVAIACLSSFMVVMDGAIVNVALPAIQADLQLSAVQLQWVVDAYLLALGGCMLLAARASDLYGRKPILQGGLLLFTMASLWGGLAENGTALLIARAMQGLGASALATSTLAVIVAVHPGGAARGRAISLWAASSAIASAVGVVLGGILTAQANWRWVMFVNVPLGALLMAAVSACLSNATPLAARPRLDWPGALCITLGMGSLMLGISQSTVQGWGSATVLLALAAAALLLTTFVVVETRARQPLIRLDIFDIPNVRLGNLVVLGLGAALTASTFFTSLLLQSVSGYGAMDTGLSLLPMALTLALAAIVSRPLMDRGVRRLPFYGGLISAAGLAWLSDVPAQALFLQHVLGPTLLVGLGLGLMLMTATHTALDGVPGKDTGLASGLFNTARQLGAALGVAILSTLAHTVTQHAQPLHSTLQAQLMGYHTVFVATAVVCAITALLTLKLRHAVQRPS